MWLTLAHLLPLGQSWVTGSLQGTDSTWAWELQSTPAPEGQTQTHGCYKQSSAHNDGKEKQS